MRYLMKFGGTSVADARCIGMVADILEKHYRAGDELAVVVSAQRGVTDQLIDIATALPTAKDDSAIAPLIQALSRRHMTTLEGAAPDYITETGAIIEERLLNLQGILSAVFYLRELTPRSKDYIISYGDRLLSPILSAALRQRGIPSRVFDGCEAGIVTTPQHGESTALHESDDLIRARIGPCLGKEIPVIMGFMGCTKDGVLTTLGRSGSDYSASIIGAGINADEIGIWTDVDGIMTCDPRVINDARVMPALSHLEVMELSFFGAKVMPPRSIEPAMRKDILVRVKNTFNPTHPGTVIVRNGQQDGRVVKALTYIDKVAAIDLNGAQMIGRPGVAGEIFSRLADCDVHVMMISQGTSEVNISFIVKRADGPRSVRILHDEFRLSEESDE